MVWGFSDIALTFQWWHQIILIIVISLIIAEGIKVGGARLIDRSEEMTETTFGRILLEELYAPLYRSVVFLGIFASAQLLNTPWLVFLLTSATASGIVILWSWAAVTLGSRVFELMNNGERANDFTPVLVIIWKLCIFIVGFFFVLSIWEIDITPVLASAGIIGIVVGVAAQGTIANLFAGISLNIDRTYKVGDVINLSSGERGVVSDVSIRSTTLTTRDNITITIPNSALNEERVVNESAPRRQRRIRLPIGVSYDTDLDHAEAVLFKISDDVKYVLDDPEPVVRYRAFGDSAIELEYMCHIRNPVHRGRTIDALIREVHVRFNDEGITIPFPQRELSYLHYDESEPLNSRTTRSSSPSEDATHPEHYDR